MKKFFFTICFALIFSVFTANISFGEEVIFDIKTKEIHQENCPLIKKHFINTTKVEKEVALKRGGKECPVCSKTRKKMILENY